MLKRPGSAMPRDSAGRQPCDADMGRNPSPESQRDGRRYVDCPCLCQRHPGHFHSFGFTLIELLVVLTILSILAATQYPSYLESVRKTRRAEGWSALMQLMQQQENHFSLHNTYIAFSADASNGYTWHSGVSPASSAYEIRAAACATETLQSCVQLTASPGTAKVSPGARDDLCGDLILRSNGIRTTSGDAAGCR